MKRHTTFAFITLLILSGLAVAVLGEDRDGQTIRLRTGSVLKFDTGSSIKDEDGNWTLSNTSLSYLSTLSTTPTISKNFATTNTPTELTNILQVFPAATKAAFSTNYTASSSDSVLFCTGTNQLITLLNATNSAISKGRMITVCAATTTGSVILTNATGDQTILGGLSISVSSTNRITVVSDGSSWW